MGRLLRRIRRMWATQVGFCTSVPSGLICRLLFPIGVTLFLSACGSGGGVQPPPPPPPDLSLSASPSARCSGKGHGAIAREGILSARTCRTGRERPEGPVTFSCPACARSLRQSWGAYRRGRCPRCWRSRDRNRTNQRLLQACSPLQRRLPWRPYPPE
jgi:hypothetical protein